MLQDTAEHVSGQLLCKTSFGWLMTAKYVTRHHALTCFLPLPRVGSGEVGEGKEGGV